MKVYKIKVNGKAYRVELEAVEETASAAPVAAKEEAKAAPAPASSPVLTGGGIGQDVPSPIQGTVVKILAKVGDKVKKGTPLVIIEAMKLENEVVSPFDGEVAEICVNKGQSVASKETIARIK